MVQARVCLNRSAGVKTVEVSLVDRPIFFKYRGCTETLDLSLDVAI